MYLYSWFKQLDDPYHNIDYVIECVWPRSVDKYLVPGQFVICVERVNSKHKYTVNRVKGKEWVCTCKCIYPKGSVLSQSLKDYPVVYN